MRPWADLVAEILELITHRLTLADRLSSSHVCKRWYSVVREVPPHNGIEYGYPCHASISLDGTTCTLVDPFGNVMHMNCSNLPCESVILFSKGGWLLMCAGPSIFFFNPLSLSRIDIPDVNFPRRIHTFAFSSAPTSPDCIVASIKRYCRFGVSVFLCRRGDKEWTEFMAGPSEFEMFYANPIFYHESLYCLGDDGRLGVFDPSKSVWTVARYPKPRPELNTKKRHVYLAESNEELIMVSTDKFGNCVHIFKLDPLTSQWAKIDRIGDRSLFVGRISSISSKADVLVGNKIYFPRTKGGAFMFYSCEEHKFHPRGNFYGSQVFNLSFWIEPVWCRTSSEEMLKWSA